MFSLSEIHWVGIFDGYRLKDSAVPIQDSNGEKVAFSLDGPDSDNVLYVPVAKGKLNGDAHIVDSHKRKLYSFQFVSNEITGPYIAYNNDHIVSRGVLKNSKREGEVLKYSNDVLIFRGTYKNDKRDGFAEEYDCHSFPLYIGYYEFGLRTTMNYDIEYNGKKYPCQLDSSCSHIIRGYEKTESGTIEGVCVEVTITNQPIRMMYKNSSQSTRLVKLFSNKHMLEYNALGNLVYEGDYKDDFENHYPRHGFGMDLHRSVILYTGGYTKNQRDGKGMAFSLKGEIVYEGYWKEGKACGEGTLYDKGVVIAKGVWEDDQLEENGQIFVVHSFLPTIEPSLDDSHLDQPTVEELVCDYEDKKQEPLYSLDSTIHRSSAKSALLLISANKESVPIECEKDDDTLSKLQSTVNQSICLSRLPEELVKDENASIASAVSITSIPTITSSYLSRMNYSFDSSTHPGCEEESLPPPIPPLPEPSNEPDQVESLPMDLNDSIYGGVNRLPLSGPTNPLPKPSSNEQDQVVDSSLHSTVSGEQVPTDSHNASSQSQISVSLDKPDQTNSHKYPDDSTTIGDRDNTQPSVSSISSSDTPTVSSPLSVGSHYIIPSSINDIAPPGSLVGPQSNNTLLPIPGVQQQPFNRYPSSSAPSFSALPMMPPSPSVSMMDYMSLVPPMPPKNPISSLPPTPLMPPIPSSPSMSTVPSVSTIAPMSPVNTVQLQSLEPIPTPLPPVSSVSTAQFHQFKPISTPLPPDPSIHLTVFDNSQPYDPSLPSVTLDNSRPYDPSLPSVTLDNSESFVGIPVSIVDHQPIHSVQHSVSSEHSTPGTIWDEVNRVYLEGVIDDNGLQGEGTIYFEDKKPYKKGFFKNSKLNGEGVIFFPASSLEEYSLIYTNSPNGEAPCVVHYQGAFKNDVLDGEGKEYDNDDNLIYEGSFKEGVYHGKGTLIGTETNYTGVFVKGKKHGHGVVHNADGILIEEGEYEADCLVSGIIKDEIGNKIAEGEFEKGDLVSGTYFYPGKSIPCCVGTFKNRVPHGMVECYSPEGKLNYKATFVDGVNEGPIEWFYEDGSLKASCSIKGGKKNGVYKEYDRSGNLRIESNYVNDVEEGEKKYIDTTGTAQVYKCVHGTLSKECCVYEDNRVVFRGLYARNQPYTGECMSYNEYENELACCKVVVKNGQMSPTMEVFATKDIQAKQLDQSWTRVYEGGWKENEFGMPVKHGKGVFSMTFKYIQGVWDDGILIDSSSIVYEKSFANSKRRKACFRGKFIFDDSSSCLSPTVVYESGRYTYEDGSFFDGYWNEKEVKVKDNVIHWPDGAIKYNVGVIRKFDLNQPSIAHEYLPDGEVNFYPKGRAIFVRGVFEPNFNCIAPPISIFRQNYQTPLVLNQNPTYSMNSDNYNVDYGYPQGY